MYWRPGNGASFLDLVEKLTGAPLAGDAWVAALEKSTADKLAQEKAAYEAALKKGPAIPPGAFLSASAVLTDAALRDIALTPNTVAIVCHGRVRRIETVVGKEERT